MPKGKGSTFGGPPVAVAAEREEEEKISLEELEGALGDPYNDLPPVVRRRVDALANLHKQYLTVQKQYQAEVAELERKYNKLYDPILDKRAQVVAGTYEPTDEEAKYERQLEEGAKLKEAKPEDASIKGIPNFWLAAMQNNPMVGDAIHDNDDEALAYLRDVRVAELTGEGQHGFTLTFHFAENPYFANSTLTKTYHMEEEETFGELLFDHATGCKIDWKLGKNLTVKQVKKKVKGKGKGKPGKVITVDEPTDSFFNFFSPPVLNDDTENPDEIADVLEADFDIGCIFKDKLIPYSLLWFTGEAAEFEDYGDYDDEDDFDEEGDDDEDDEDEEEEDEHPPKRGGGGRGGGRGGPGHTFAPPPTSAKGGAGAPGQPPQPECKQQ